jgi:hypothetical protein
MVRYDVCSLCSKLNKMGEITDDKTFSSKCCFPGAYVAFVDLPYGSGG